MRRVLLQELAEPPSISKRSVLGEYSSHFGAAITREANVLRGVVATGVKCIIRRGCTPLGKKAVEIADAEEGQPDLGE